MSSIAQQVKDIEEQLRKQAQRLGGLNLKSNDYIEMNQKLAFQIVELKNKIAKKKHMIEQQNKDKMLIHQKLIKAEREKQLLQIENNRKKQQKQKQLEKQLQEQNNKPITNHIQTLTAKENENKVEQSYVQQNNQVQKHQTQEKKPVKIQQDKKQPEQTTPQHHTQQYTETDRGQYQPPMLFEENQHHSEEEKQQKSQDQDSDSEDEDVLAKLRATVKEDDDQEDQDKQ